jgi:hypothetical protein
LLGPGQVNACPDHPMRLAAFAAKAFEVLVVTLIFTVLT